MRQLGLAVEALGYTLAPVAPDPVPPVRTPEAIYDDAAYARGRGGV